MISGGQKAIASIGKALKITPFSWIFFTTLAANLCCGSIFSLFVPGLINSAAPIKPIERTFPIHRYFFNSEILFENTVVMSLTWVIISLSYIISNVLNATAEETGCPE